MTLLRIDATIKTQGSASSEVADLVEEEWTAAHPGDAITRRHLGLEPLPSDAWGAAVSAGWTPAEDQSDLQRDSAVLAAGLVSELTEADAVLLAFPLYNFGVTQHVKAWIDLVIAGSTPGSQLLAGKPVVLVVTRGGSYSAGTPREGWDHSTAYLQRILADVWGGDLTTVEREWTLVGVNPALDDFKDLAEVERDRAHGAAREAGKALGV